MAGTTDDRRRMAEAEVEALVVMMMVMMRIMFSSPRSERRGEGRERGGTSLGLMGVGLTAEDAEGAEGG